MEVKYIINSNGDINLVVNDESFCISPTHPNYNIIKKSLQNKKYDHIKIYCDIGNYIQKVSNTFIEAKYNSFYDRKGREKSWDYIQSLIKSYNKLVETKNLYKSTLWELLN